MQDGLSFHSVDDMAQARLNAGIALGEVPTAQRADAEPGLQADPKGMSALPEAPRGQIANPPARYRTNPSHRILVVDSDLSIRQLSTRLLGRLGYKVDAAADGETGWQALYAHSYDLLITDNNIPRLSGVGLLERLRSSQMTLPVILASGTLPTDELNRIRRLQLAATLLKPFTAYELLETVKEVLRAAVSVRSRSGIYFPVLAEAICAIKPWPRWGINE
jgi:CheY-like chemotaxis protein